MKESSAADKKIPDPLPRPLNNESNLIINRFGRSPSSLWHYEPLIKRDPSKEWPGIPWRHRKNIFWRETWMKLANGGSDWLERISQENPERIPIATGEHSSDGDPVPHWDNSKTSKLATRNFQSSWWNPWLIQRQPKTVLTTIPNMAQRQPINNPIKMMVSKIYIYKYMCRYKTR